MYRVVQKNGTLENNRLFWFSIVFYLGHPVIMAIHKTCKKSYVQKIIFIIKKVLRIFKRRLLRLIFAHCFVSLWNNFKVFKYQYTLQSSPNMCNCVIQKQPAIYFTKISVKETSRTHQNFPGGLDVRTKHMNFKRKDIILL